MRVFELARDLGVTSKALLAALEKMGIEVEDHAARLSADDEKKVRLKLQKKAAPAKRRKAPAAKAAPAAPPPKEKPAPKPRVVVKRRKAETLAATPEPEPEAAPAAAAAEPEAEAEQPAAPKAPVKTAAERLKPAAETPTPEGLTPRMTAASKAKRERVVIDLEKAKAKAKAPASKPEPEPAPEAAEAPPEDKPGAPLPSAGNRVRAARPEAIETPKGLTPHISEARKPGGERVVIDLPKEAPARPARTERTERPERPRRKGRDAPAAEPAAARPDAAPKPAADTRKRKWQSFKGKKGRRGREERLDELARPRRDRSAEFTRPRVRAIRIQEGTTVKEFAESLGVKVSAIIGELMKMGALATLNDPIDMDAAQLIADSMGVNTERVMEKTEDELLEVVPDAPETLQPRAPVVTIMGHVDHGKTSLLDAIRTTRVTAGEAGGITQHIGAYGVETERGRVVFLDTPGHEAFTSMRARGAQMTDIVVLVVAADDGVMPQTVEAIHHAREAGVPILVAITKIDKDGADPDRVTGALGEHELIPEDWGGQTQFARVSAHTMAGLPELLEKILLQAEIMELKANPDKPAVGHVVEARLDRGRGPVATVLVQGGTLKVGDFFVVGTHTGRVRAMSDDLGNKLEAAGPATPVEIIGLEGVPMAGDPFNAVVDEKAAKEVATDRRLTERTRELAREKKLSLDDLFSKMQEEETVELPLVLRGDVQGSVEAIQEALEKLSTDQVKVKILHTGVGGITETDVMLASASNGTIIAFSVRPEPKASKLAEHEGVDIRSYNVIYDLVDDVKAAMEGLLKPTLREKVLGRAEVREVFSIPKVGNVAGCFVLDGTIQRNAAGLRVVRDNVVVYEGPILTLKRFKDDVKEVAKGYECGISFERFNDIKQGDVIEAFALEEVAAKL
jgi:translation initiation factor IF-2